MTSDSPSTSFGPASAGERFVDAALSEHARLGRDGTDEELVLRILQETVHRRPVSDRAIVRVSRDWRGITVTLGAVAAALALTLVALSAFRVGGPGERRTDELRFVVRTDFSASPAKPEPLRVSSTEVGRVAHRIDFELAAGPALGKPVGGVRSETLRITADRGGASGKGYAYEGHVLVELEAFRIEAASVRLTAPGEEPLLANRVRVTRSEPACVAEADHLSFDPVSGSLVLTGVSRVETDKGLLAHFAPSDRLVLSGGGFSVESGAVER